MTVSYLTPTTSTPAAVNVGATAPTNCVDAGHAIVNAPALVKRNITTCDALVTGVLLNANVVLPVIVAVHSVADAKFNVCVPETLPRVVTP